MNFHRLRLIRFSKTILSPRASQRTQEIQNEKFVQEKRNVVNHSKIAVQENHKNTKNNESTTKCVRIVCNSTKPDGRASLVNKSKSVTILGLSLRKVKANAGCRRTMSLSDIKRKITQKKQVYSKHISHTLQSFSRKNDINNESRKILHSPNSNKIKTILAAPKQRSTCTSSSNKHSQNLYSYALHSCEMDNNYFPKVIKQAYLRRKRSLERKKSNLVIHNPIKLVTSNVTNMKPAKSISSHRLCHFNVVHFPTSKVTLRSKPSLRLFQRAADIEDNDFCDRRSLNKVASDKDNNWSIQQTKLRRLWKGGDAIQSFNYGKHVSKVHDKPTGHVASTVSKHINVRTCDNAVTSTSKENIMNVKNVPLSYKRKETEAQSWHKEQDKKKAFCRNNSLIINFPSKIVHKLKEIFPFFIKHRNPNRSILKCILFSIIVFVWSPCIIAVIISWYLSYPFRPQHFPSRRRPFQGRLQRKCYGDGKKHHKSALLCPNFVNCVKHFFTTSTSSVETVKYCSTSKNKVRNNNKKRRVSLMNLSRTQMHPNPNEKYTLFHASGKGWVIKPISNGRHKQYRVRQIFHNKSFDSTGISNKKSQHIINSSHLSSNNFHRTSCGAITSHSHRILTSAPGERYSMCANTDCEKNKSFTKNNERNNLEALTGIAYCSSSRRNVSKMYDRQHKIESQNEFLHNEHCSLPQCLARSKENPCDHRYVAQCKTCLLEIPDRIHISKPQSKSCLKDTANNHSQSMTQCKKSNRRITQQSQNRIAKCFNENCQSPYNKDLRVIDHLKITCHCKSSLQEVVNESPSIPHHKECMQDISKQRHGYKATFHKESSGNSATSECKKCIQVPNKDSRYVPQNFVQEICQCKKCYEQTPAGNRLLTQRGRMPTKDYKVVHKRSGSAVNLNGRELQEAKYLRSRSQSAPKRKSQENVRECQMKSEESSHRINKLNPGDDGNQLAAKTIIKRRNVKCEFPTCHCVARRNVLDSGKLSKLCGGDHLASNLSAETKCECPIRPGVTKTNSLNAGDLNYELNMRRPTYKSYCPLRPGPAKQDLFNPALHIKRRNAGYNIHNKSIIRRPGVKLECPVCRDIKIKKKVKLSHMNTLKRNQLPSRHHRKMRPIRIHTRCRRRIVSAATQSPSTKDWLKMKPDRNKSTWLNKVYRWFRTAGSSLSDTLDRIESDQWKNEARCDRLLPQSLKKRPCFWIYKCWPKCYPYFLDCRQSCQNSCHHCLLCCSACAWCPLLCCCYICINLCCRLWR